MKLAVDSGYLEINSPKDHIFRVNLTEFDLVVSVMTKKAALANKDSFPANGLFLLEASDGCYVGKASDLKKVIVGSPFRRKLDFYRCFILTSDKDSRFSQYDEYMVSYAIDILNSKGYSLIYPRVTEFSDIEIEQHKKEICQKWVDQFLDILPVFLFRFVTEEIREGRTEVDTLASPFGDGSDEPSVHPAHAGGMLEGWSSPDKSRDSGWEPIKGFILNGDKVECTSDKDAMLSFVRKMQEIDPSFLDRLDALDTHSKSDRRYIARTRDALYGENSRELTNAEVLPGWFVDLSVSPISIRHRISFMLEHANKKLVSYFLFLE